MSASSGQRMNRFLGRIAEERANRARTTKKASLPTARRRQDGVLREPERNGSPAEIAEVHLTWELPKPRTATTRVQAVAKFRDRTGADVQAQVLFKNVRNLEGEPAENPNEEPASEEDNFYVPKEGFISVKCIRGIDHLGIATEETERGLAYRNGAVDRNSGITASEYDDITGLFGGIQGSRSNGTITG